MPTDLLDCTKKMNRFYFKIIVDSQEVAKIVQRHLLYPSSSFPLWLLFFFFLVIIEKYHNQETDTGTICMSFCHMCDQYH